MFVDGRLLIPNCQGMRWKCIVRCSFGRVAWHPGVVFSYLDNPTLFATPFRASKFARETDCTLPVRKSCRRLAIRAINWIFLKHNKDYGDS